MADKTIKIYMAGHQPCRLGIQLLIDYLQQIFLVVEDQVFSRFKKTIEYRIVSTWHRDKFKYASTPPPTFKGSVGKDIDELESADLLIAMYPFGNGSRSEISIGLGRDIPMIALIPKEHVLSDYASTGWSDNFPLARFDTWKHIYEDEDDHLYNQKHVIATSYTDLCDILDYLICNFIMKDLCNE